MKLTEAKCRVSGIRIGELEANLLSQRPILKAKIMLVDTEGYGYGMYTSTSRWSEKTIENLNALLESMENDVLGAIFELPQDAEEPKQF